MESVAVVPLLTEGRCVSALSLMSEEADAWSGVSSVLLEEIAASMAAALEHCMAYEEVGHAVFKGRRHGGRDLLEENRRDSRPGIRLLGHQAERAHTAPFCQKR